MPMAPCHATIRLSERPAPTRNMGLGHRNMQGAAIHPVTGKLWTNEHGPKGGDELNIPAPGRNYGWPVVGYGIDYSGQKCTTAPARPGWSSRCITGCRQSHHPAWRSHTADRFPSWRGSLFIGALAGEHLARLTLDGERVVAEERLLVERKERIRDVRQGPDRFIYVLTDERNGKLLKVSP